MIYRALVILSLLVVAVTGTSPALGQQATLVFGVLNQQSPALTAERWNPILHYLSSVSGVPLRLKMGATVQVTDAMMGLGQFDFVFTNHNFRTEYEVLCYAVIARRGVDTMPYVISVTLDSPLQVLAELTGKRVAFPSSDAFVGYAVPMATLKNAQVRVEEVFTGNQEGALAQLKVR